MSLQLITPPSVEPVTLDEAKLHLKVDTTDDDALIERLITAARARAEWHTGRAFITQSWVLWSDCWAELVEIPLPPLQAVTAVNVYAGDGTATTIDASNYTVDAASQPARVLFGCIPPIALRAINAVSIAFTAGYGDAAGDVPAPVCEAILEIAAELYTHRGDGPEEISLSAQALLAPYRVFKL
ncbi:MAG TPA: head-tail connector protein [Rhizomicrobium sp.]|nr:head-tail connector protein [Rhizomicrobium sp.]